MHYSWIWAHICETEGIKVLWVGHAEAVHYRKQNKLPNKNYQADALALAAYTLLHWGDDVKREFGNLVISQTAAYGCRLLFKELKQAVTND